MECPCRKNSFDLRISHTDRKHMLITDVGEWMNNEKPENCDIRITNALHNITSIVSILAKGTNVLSTIELFGTEKKLCLQDGFYCISADSCGHTYTINRVYLANTACMIDQLYVKAKTKEHKDKINDFYQDLKMIEINTNIGRLKSAQEIFTTLTKKLKALGCNDCGC